MGSGLAANGFGRVRGYGWRFVPRPRSVLSVERYIEIWSRVRDKKLTAVRRMNVPSAPTFEDEDDDENDYDLALSEPENLLT